MKEYLVIFVLALLVVLGLGYFVVQASACWGQGALVKNAWGGLSCVPVVR